MMSGLYYIGIDPGKNGALVEVSHTGAVVRQSKMPDTDEGLLGWFKPPRVPATLTKDYRGPLNTIVYAQSRVAMIERVNAGVWGARNAGFTMGAVSAFTFGCGFGKLLMALLAAEIPYTLVMPQVWQKAMDCRTHGDKNISKVKAQALFPGLKVTHGNADALLIASYCRHVHQS